MPGRTSGGRGAHEPVIPFRFDLTEVATSQNPAFSTPVFVQSMDHGEFNGSDVLTTLVVNLPNPTQAGNCLVATFFWRGSTTFTPSDDKGNTWVVVKSIYDSTNNRNLAIARALNVAAGTQKITFTMGTADFKERIHVSEWYNVALSSADDGSGGQLTTGTTLATGSWSTTTPNDLIIFSAYLDDEPALSDPMSWTKGSGFTLLEADGASFGATQYQIRASTGSWNPSITSSFNATGAIAVAIALKSANAGSAPAAGIHVNRLHAITIPSVLTGTTGATITVQAPSSGNLIAILCNSPTGRKITGISSSPANTWDNSPGSVDDSPSGYSYSSWFAGNATTSGDMTITVTLPAGIDSTSMIFQLEIYDISGAAVAPFDKSATATGSLAAPSGTVNGPSLTPATANGVILIGGDQVNQAVQSTSPGLLMSCLTNGTFQAFSMDADSLFGIYYNPTTATYNSTITYYAPTGSGTNVSDWWALAAAFKAPSAAASIFRRTLSALGTRIGSRQRQG